MNNYQWLLQMDGAERKAWFDAEHEESAQLKDMFGILGNLPTDPGEAAIAAVEGFVRERSNDTFRGENDAKAGSECPNDENGTLDGDTEPENADSRERLEADVRKIADAYNMDTQRHGTERFADELYYSIIHLLNRQRAIDDSICDECSSDYYEMQEEHDQMVDDIAKLMRLKQPYTFDPGKPLENIETIGRYIDELTAERDKLKELNGYHAAQYELASEDCDRLQAEVDTLKSRHCPHYDATEHTCDVHETRIAELTAERERYRSKFGKCLDYADAIHALMDDEGLA